VASRDYEEFIAALNAHGVRYLIVGAHAVALHARPRATLDLDVLIERTPANARKLLKALLLFFDGASLGYKIEDLIDPRWVLQLGVAPMRIDVLPSIPGIEQFSVAWKNRVRGKFGSVPASFIGRADLIVAKRAAGRLQDRADLRSLLRVSEPPPARPRTKRRKPSH
jgi:hypothetical protein